MTEEIEDDKHKSDPAIKMAVMEVYLKESRKQSNAIMSQLDIIVGKVSKVETSLMLGDRRFDDLEAVQKETTQELEAVGKRVDGMEKKQDGIANKVIGGAAVVGFLASAWHWIKEAAKSSGSVFLLCILLTGCDSRKSRAQAAADLNAGIAAAIQAAADAGAQEAVAILTGAQRYVAPAAGVNTADMPAPRMTPEEIRSDPQGYGNEAPPEPERWTFWAMAGTAGAFALALLRVAAPMVPGGGPLLSGAANLAWTLMSTRNQKAADAAATIAQQAAANAKPLLDALRAAPLESLPDNVREAIRNPHVAQAVDKLATTEPKA